MRSPDLTLPMRSTPPARRTVADRLNRDWARLVADPATAARLRSWPGDLRAAACPDLDVLLAATGRDGGLTMEDADGLLAQLVALAAHDELAARVVLQRVVPGLVLAALRRTRSRPGDRGRAFDDLAAAAWLVIRTYPLARRPTKVAVNILRDAEYHAFVRAARLRSALEERLPPGAAEGWQLRTALDGRAASRDRTPCEELAEVLATARRRGVDAADLDLLRTLYLDGVPSAEVARRYDVTTRTVRNWRATAAARVASAVLA